MICFISAFRHQTCNDTCIKKFYNISVLVAFISTCFI
uniref:Uncharacterized protein n=1 Tax=Rhizophora mucronata TaxID=61149 RepID=A0A2P2R350_RHIMU